MKKLLSIFVLLYAFTNLQIYSADSKEAKEKTETTIKLINKTKWPAHLLMIISNPGQYKCNSLKSGESEEISNIDLTKLVKFSVYLKYPKLLTGSELIFSAEDLDFIKKLSSLREITITYKYKNGTAFIEILADNQKKEFYLKYYEWL